MKEIKNEKILKHKARLAVKGYAQKQVKDYDEVFAPITRIETVPITLAFSAQFGWSVYHLDVKTAFVNGEISEEILVTQPQGYEDLKRNNDVCKLQKALHGLKQATRAWYFKLDKSLTSHEMKKSEFEPAFYYKMSRVKSDSQGVCG